MATEKLIKAEVLDQYGHEIKDYIDRGDSDLADSISNTDERVTDLDKRLTDDINNFENRIEKTELKNQDQDLEILELKHLIYETVVDHVEATIENVDVKPIPDYVDQHKVIDGGEIMLSEILGKTEKWNQLVINSHYQSYAPSEGYFAGLPAFGKNSIEGHKYLFMAFSSSNVSGFRIRNPQVTDVYTGTFIYNCSVSGLFNAQAICINQGDFSVDYALTDLTDKFGAGNEPTSVDDPRIQKLIDDAKEHPEYDAGSLHSVMAENFKVNGANIWNEEWEVGRISGTGSDYAINGYIRSKGYIPVIGGLRYYFKSGAAFYRLAFYDAEKSFLRDITSNIANTDIPIPLDARYIRFAVIQSDSTYHHDICISLGSANVGYKPHKAPFVLNFLQGNQLKTTETKTLGTLTMTADRGKLTLSGMSMATMAATIGETLLKAGTYSYRIENPSGDNVGLYDITGDDWLFASSRPVLQGTFTLETDKTIAMGLDARVGTNYGGREIKYMVAKGSETLNEFKQDGITEPIELNGIGDVHDRLIIEQQPDTMTFNLVLERETGKVDLGTLNWQSSSTTANGFYASNVGEYPRNRNVKALCSKYEYDGYASSSIGYYGSDKTFRLYVPDAAESAKEIYIKDSSYSNAQEFKQAMSGVILVYQLANPTRETLIEGLTESQVATLLEKGGTIEVGNETITLPDVKVWLEVRKLEA